MQNLEAQIIISALDRASKVFGGIGNSANTMVGRLGRAEQRISAFGVAAMASLGVSAFGVAGLVSSSVKAYAKWEDALADFGNTVNVHGAQLDTYGDHLRDAAAGVGQMQEEMLNVAKLMAGRGMDAAVAVNMADDVGKAATAAGASMEDMAAAAFAAQSNLKMAESEIPKAFDMMAQAGKAGGFELKDMARWMPELTASMADLGTKGAEGLAEISAASQIAMKNAGSPDQAANNLSNFFGKLRSADTTKKFRDKLGIDLSKVFQKSAKQGTSYFLDMLDLIQEKTKGDPFKIAELFPDKQASDAVRALLANKEEFLRILDQVRNANGVIDADFERRMNTITGKMAQISAKWEQLKLTGGEFVAPTVIEGLNQALAILNNRPESVFAQDVKDVEKLIALYHHLARLIGAEPTTATTQAEDRIRRERGLPLWEDVSGILKDEQRQSREGLTDRELKTARARKAWFEKQLNGRPINDDGIRQQMIDEGLIAPPSQPDAIPVPRRKPSEYWHEGKIGKRHRHETRKEALPTQAEIYEAQDLIWRDLYEREKLLPDIPWPPPRPRGKPPRNFQGGHDTRDIKTILRQLGIEDPEGLGGSFDGLPALKVVQPVVAGGKVADGKGDLQVALPQTVASGKGDLPAGVRPGLAPPGPDIRAVLMDMKTLFENPEFVPGTLDRALAGKVEAVVNKPVTATLEGQASVNVRIRVEGPGRVVDVQSKPGKQIVPNTLVDNTGAHLMNRGQY